MHQLPLDQLVPYLFQSALLVALIVRLWLAGLQRKYPYFFSYILTQAVQAAVLLAIPFDSRAYVWTWVVSEALNACFYVLIVNELYKVVLGDLPGIATVLRRYFRATVTIAMVISLLVLSLEEAPRNSVSTVLLVERAIVLSVVIFILLITVFLVLYPVRLNRNVAAYSIGYSVYFVVKTAGLFIRTSGHYVMRQISTVLMAVSCACVLFWIFSLSRRGEKRLMIIGHKWTQKDEDLVISKIKEINDNLVSTGKK